MERPRPLIELLDNVEIGDLVELSSESGKSRAGYLVEVKYHNSDTSKIADVYFSDEPDGDPVFILKIEKSGKDEEIDNFYYEIKN